MERWKPSSGETACDFLSGRVGRFILLNVIIQSQPTSVCINIEAGGRAAGRRKEKNKGVRLLPTQPFFSVTEETICLSYNAINSLADNFQGIHDALPKDAFNKNLEAALGTIPRDGVVMEQVLTSLESKSADIRMILASLDSDLNTPILALRKASGRSALSHLQFEPNTHACTGLMAFSDSRQLYATLPGLRGFGTANSTRSAERPNMRGALLRYYMQQNPTNPLRTSFPLDFVDYELKPLNISSGIKWSSDCDPRTDSIDLLLSLDGAAALTEVKMAGDGFLSAGLIQLLYYTSIMANSSQVVRLRREFTALSSNDVWLCLIAEERDERNSQEAGFTQDKQSTIAFLSDKRCKGALHQWLRGAVILIVREMNEPYCTARRIPRFEAIEEHRIAWTNSTM